MPALKKEDVLTFYQAIIILFHLERDRNKSHADRLDLIVKNYKDYVIALLLQNKKPHRVGRDQLVRQLKQEQSLNTALVDSIIRDVKLNGAELLQAMEKKEDREYALDQVQKLYQDRLQPVQQQSFDENKSHLQQSFVTELAVEKYQAHAAQKLFERGEILLKEHPEKALVQFIQAYDCQKKSLMHTAEKESKLAIYHKSVSATLGKLAEKYNDEKKFEEVIKIYNVAEKWQFTTSEFDDLLSIQDSAISALNGIAVNFNIGKKFDNALEKLTEARNLLDKTYHRWSDLSDFPERKRVALALLSRHPKSLKNNTARVLFNIGNTYFQNGEHEKALSKYTESFDNQPNYDAEIPELHDKISECLRLIGDKYYENEADEKALSKYTESFRNNNHPPERFAHLQTRIAECLYNQGCLLLAEKKYGPALKKFTEAYHNQSDPPPVTEIGRLRLEQCKKAIAYMRKNMRLEKLLFKEKMDYKLKATFFNRWRTLSAITAFRRAIPEGAAIFLVGPARGSVATTMFSAAKAITGVYRDYVSSTISSTGKKRSFS